jgi:hypothetical protein
MATLLRASINQQIAALGVPRVSEPVTVGIIADLAK